MKLVLTDTSVKARRVWEILGKSKDWTVISTDGPVVDFVSRGLGVDTRFELTPNWEEKPALRDILAKAREAESIYLLLPRSDEGAFIAGHLKSQLAQVIDPSCVYHGHLQEVTSAGVKDAITGSFDDDEAFDASVTRRMVDRLLSGKLTQDFSKATGLRGVKLSRLSLLLLGRACSVYAARMHTPYKWRLSVAGTNFEGWADTEDDALAVAEAWKKLSTSDVSVSITLSDEDPPKPLTVGSIFAICRDHGLRASDVADQLRLLYEHGFTTAPSNGTHMAEAFVASCHSFLQAVSPDLCGSNPSGTGPECIRPVDINVGYTRVPKRLRKVYHIIWSYTLASTAAPSRVHETYVSSPDIHGTRIAGTTWEAATPGFHKVLQDTPDPVTPEYLLGSELIVEPRRPSLDYLSDCAIVSHMAQIYPSHTTVVNEIGNMCASGVLKWRDGHLAPTMLGLLVYGWVKRSAPELLDEGMTSVLEQRLSLLRSGRDSRKAILSDYFSWLEARRPVFRSTEIPKVEDGGETRSVVFDTGREPYLSGHSTVPMAVDTEGNPTRFVSAQVPGYCSSCGDDSLSTVYGRYGIYVRCSSCKSSMGDYL